MIQLQLQSTVKKKKKHLHIFCQNFWAEMEIGKVSVWGFFIHNMHSREASMFLHSLYRSCGPVRVGIEDLNAFPYTKPVCGCFPLNCCILNQQHSKDRCAPILPLRLDGNHRNKKLPFVLGIAECHSEDCLALVNMPNTRQQ